MKPLLKWAGGKRRLLGILKENLPGGYGTYHEPFIGGGALFFELAPERAVVSDLNAEMMNFYSVVRDGLPSLLESLAAHVNTKEHYLDVRSWDRADGWPDTRSSLERASRFLFLNKTCFNGLWRVNSKGGYFNVPYANPKRLNMYDAENIAACSDLFRRSGVSLSHGSFADNENLVNKGDLVYLDPPYIPVTETASFTGYTKEGFGSELQISLRDYCRRIDKIGAKFMLSNSHTQAGLELYRDFDVRVIDAPRSISRDGAGRKPVQEILVRNY